ncbi:MAG: uridine kinase [Pyrinomonadaceae bacterium]
MIIGISGGTGSGKTTIAREFVERLGSGRAELIEQDSYYRNLANIPLDERRLANFDHPDSVDFEALCEQLSALKNGEAVEVPIYDFSTHTRSEKTRTVFPAPVIVVEGILILSQRKLNELIDVKVFVDTPDDIRLVRRIRRDIQERGRTLEQTLEQYERTIRPMHLEYVAPGKDVADIILPASKGSDDAIEMLTNLVRSSPTSDELFA